MPSREHWAKAENGMWFGCECDDPVGNHQIWYSRQYAQAIGIGPYGTSIRRASGVIRMG